MQLRATIIRIVLVYSFISACAGLIARQPAPINDTIARDRKSFDHANFDKYRTGKDFNYQEQYKRPVVNNGVFRWLDKSLRWLDGNPLLNLFFRALPYLLILGTIIWFAIKYLDLQPRSHHMYDLNTQSSEKGLMPDGRLLNKNWKILFKDAYAANNPDDFVFLVFQAFLSELKNMQHIQWYDGIGIQDVLKNIKDPVHHQFIEQLAWIHAYVIYGNYPLKNDTYHTIKQMALQRAKALGYEG